MRSDDDIRAELRNVFEFAHINSWCTQLDERIAAFIESVPDNDREPVQLLLEREYVSADAHNEQVVLVVLLGRKLGGRVIDTTERLFARLRGRLSLADQRFLSTHLFGGPGPLPSDVNHDIVARPYLSFRRAISRAMSIETVSSTFTASEVGLYLTLIMCRADLNEQNRAILSFLLSRIDAELPQNVLEGVFVYLRSLRTVIAEVEGQGDAALTKEFHYSDEPTIEDQSQQTVEPTRADAVAPEPQPPAPAPLAAGTTAAPATSAAVQRPVADDTASREATEPQPPRAPVSSLNQAVRSRDRVQGTFGIGASDPPTPDHGSVDRPGVSHAPSYERRGTLSPTRNDAARTVEVGSIAPASDSDLRGGFDPTQGSVPAEGDADSQLEQPRSAEDAAPPEEHTIYFNRNTAELLRIIDGLDRDDQLADTPSRTAEPVVTEPVVTEPPATDARQRPNRAATLPEDAGSAQTRRSGKLLRRAAIAIVATALPVLAVLALWPDRSRVEPSEATGSAASDGVGVDPGVRVDRTGGEVPVATGSAASDGVGADPGVRVDRTGGEVPVATGGAASDAAVAEPPAAASGVVPEAVTVEPEPPAEPRAPGAAGVDQAPSIDRTGGEPPGAARRGLPDTVAVEPEPPAAESQPSGAAGAYRIEFDGDRFVWIVESGQTGWELFRAAGSAPIAGDGAVRYAVPPRVTWRQYILDVFAANPALAQFRIITAGPANRLAELPLTGRARQR